MSTVDSWKPLGVCGSIDTFVFLFIPACKYIMNKVLDERWSVENTRRDEI